MIGRNLRDAQQIREALHARRTELDARKRLPRGFSVGDLREKLAHLESLILDCDSAIRTFLERDGVQVGDRIPVDLTNGEG